MTQAEARRKLKPSAKAILRTLRYFGKQGAETHSLMNVSYQANGRYYRGCSRYGARLHELRKAGYRIDSYPDRPGSYTYVLRSR